jgi:outer membrane protein assembly factor BamE (lipoprotein component of BamABCDE complex)
MSRQKKDSVIIGSINMIKKATIEITLLVLILFASSACWRVTQSRNRGNLMSLKLDMTKEDVIRIMGKPTLNEAYKTDKGKNLEILFYYTNRTWADGNITRDECTPIVFEDGKVIGWGNEFYKTRVELEIKKNN